MTAETIESPGSSPALKVSVYRKAAPTVSLGLENEHSLGEASPVSEALWIASAFG